MPKDRRIKWIMSGQPRPYTDTLRVFEVDADDEADADLAVKEAGYQTKNKISQDRLGASGHNGGASGFPFGMDSFYSVTEISPKRFKIVVTEPYTD